MPEYRIFKVSYTQDIKHHKYTTLTTSVHVVARNSTQARSLVFRESSKYVPFKQINATYEPVDAIVEQMKPTEPQIIDGTQRTFYQ